MTALRRHLVLLCLVLLVAGAVLATALRGDPLGRAIGGERFPHRLAHGSAVVETTAPADLASTAAWLDGWMTAVAAWAGTPVPPTTVRLCSDRAEYVSICTGGVPGFNPRMDWCYDPNGGIVYGWIARPADMQRRLRHETFHHLSARHIAGMPLWLNEGVAELLEGAELQEGRLAVTTLQKDRLRLAARLASRGALHDRLAGITPSEFYGRDSQNWYSLSYAAAAALHAEGRLGDAVRAAAAAAPPASLSVFAGDGDRWQAARSELSVLGGGR